MEASQLRTQQGHASDLRQHRRLPQGADVLPSGGVHFRVWASRRQHVEVILEGGPGHRPGVEPISIALEPEGDGYFSGLVPEASAGTLYRYRLNGGTESYPDAASRFQPHGPRRNIRPAPRPLAVAADRPRVSVAAPWRYGWCGVGTRIVGAALLWGA